MTTIMGFLYDQFIQEWTTSVNNSTKLSYYCKFKMDFMYEKYLDNISNYKFVKLFECFRLSSHKLETEAGIVRENMLCYVNRHYLIFVLLKC